MFIRASSQRDKKSQQVYTTYRLVQAYRNESGSPRQETLLNLGCHFSVPKSEWKQLTNRIEEIHQGQSSLLACDTAVEKEAQRITRLMLKSVCALEEKAKSPLKPKGISDFQTVDVNTLEYRDIRKIGSEHVGYHAACQLELDKLLSTLGFNKKQVDLALATIIGRLIHPGSDLSTHRYLTEQSALDDLLETDFSSLPLKQFYKIADKLYTHKKAIEAGLYRREKALFDLKEVVTLYDITNTYFEGRCFSNSKAEYGRSKEKRSDCRLVALGMVLDASGFPKKSKIFPGNVSEPKTLKEMLGALEVGEKATIVMDAGIATEENIEWLKASGYEYIVVTRKQNLVIPPNVDSVIVKQDKHNTVQASLVKNEETGELELYCHSQAKQEKAIQLVSKAETRYELELKKLAAGLTKKGHTKKYVRVIERLGRLKERYKKVGKYFNVTVSADEENTHAIAITWEKANKPNNHHLGIYCLRTNKTDLDERNFWKTYTMLTDLEAAFRSLKSELGFRPIYHQKESRIDAHLFISILAYHLLHTLRYQLKQHNIHESWQTLRELLSTQCRITSSLRLESGKMLHIRKTNSPDFHQRIIYQALGISTHPGKTEKTYI